MSEQEREKGRVRASNAIHTRRALRVRAQSVALTTTPCALCAPRTRLSRTEQLKDICKDACLMWVIYRSPSPELTVLLTCGRLNSLGAQEAWTHSWIGPTVRSAH